jgi:hypothetical protein
MILSPAAQLAYDLFNPDLAVHREMDDYMINNYPIPWEDTQNVNTRTNDTRISHPTGTRVRKRKDDTKEPDEEGIVKLGDVLEEGAAGERKRRKGKGRAIQDDEEHAE